MEYQVCVILYMITWIAFLYQRLRALPIWPSRQVDANMPACFKISYPQTHVIIDCTEVFELSVTLGHIATSRETCFLHSLCFRYPQDSVWSHVTPLDVLLLDLPHSVGNKLLVRLVSPDPVQRYCTVTYLVTDLSGWPSNAFFRFSPKLATMCADTSSSPGIVNPFFVRHDFAASKPWLT